MVKALRLNHINLNVSDIERSVRFYEHALGLVEDFRAGPRMVFLHPSAGMTSSRCIRPSRFGKSPRVWRTSAFRSRAAVWMTPLPRW